jgi:hypothetical protein
MNLDIYINHIQVPFQLQDGYNQIVFCVCVRKLLEVTDSKTQTQVGCLL